MDDIGDSSEESKTLVQVQLYKKIVFHVNAYFVFQELGESESIADSLSRSCASIVKKLKDDGKTPSKAVVCKIVLHEFLKQYRITPKSNDDTPPEILNDQMTKNMVYQAPTFSIDSIDVWFRVESDSVECLFRVKGATSYDTIDLNFGLVKIIFSKSRRDVRLKFAKCEEWRTVVWKFLKPKDVSFKNSSSKSTPSEEFLNEDSELADWDLYEV